MKLKILLSVFLSAIVAVSGLSQDTKTRCLSVDAGIDFISGGPPEKDYIRADRGQFFSDFPTTSLRGLFYRNYVSIKGEKTVLNNKVGLVSGIRYTRTESSIGKESYWSNSSDFFYLLLRQEETRTDYLKVNEITQLAGYLAIPLEIRIYPYRPRAFNVYYKIGGDVNYRLHSRTRTVFFNSDMKIFEDEIENVIEKPWVFYSSFDLGVGFRIGMVDKPGVNLEIHIPVTMIRGGKQDFVTPEAGTGIQLNARIPF